MALFGHEAQSGAGLNGHQALDGDMVTTAQVEHSNGTGLDVLHGELQETPGHGDIIDADVVDTARAAETAVGDGGSFFDLEIPNYTVPGQPSSMGRLRRLSESLRELSSNGDGSGDLGNDDDEDDDEPADEVTDAREREDVWQEQETPADDSLAALVARSQAASTFPPPVISATQPRRSVDPLLRHSAPDEAEEAYDEAGALPRLTRRERRAQDAMVRERRRAEAEVVFQQQLAQEAVQLQQTLTELKARDRNIGLEHTAELAERLRLAVPVETEDMLWLRNPRLLNDMVRASALHRLGQTTGIAWEQGAPLQDVELAHVQALYADAVQGQKRKVPLGTDPNPGAHDKALAEAWTMTSRHLNGAQRDAMGDVYVNPFPEGSTHREVAFGVLRDAVGIAPHEFEISERTREMTVSTRLVVGEDGLYQTDDGWNGIVKILGACGETLENNDPSGRDHNLSGLITKGPSHTYEGGLCVEVRIAGFQIERAPRKSGMDPEELDKILDSPSIICTAEVEPRHVTPDTMTRLMLDRTTRYSGIGREALIDPTYFPITAAQALKDVVIPASKRFADDSRDVHLQAQRHVSEQLAIRGWNVAQTSGMLIVPPQLELPSPDMFGPNPDALPGVD